MKKYVLLFATAASAFLSSCKNDFDVNAPRKEIPVVYGLLDYDSSMQYIKVERVFADQSTSAITLAQNPDSVYFNYPLAVEIRGYDGFEVPKTPIYTFQLVNGDTIPGFPKKQTGSFVSSPNYFYRLYTNTATTRLNKNYFYKLTIKKGDGTVLASSQTDMVDSSVLTKPTEHTTAANKKINFIDVTNGNKIGIAFNSAVHGKVYDFVIRLNYKEVNKTTNATVYKFADYTAITGIISPDVNISTPITNYTFSGTGFYQNLALKIAKDATVNRYSTGIDFQIFSGNETFYNYMNVQAAHNGFTTGNVQPDYTNITGGLGLFASRHMKVAKGYMFTPTSTSLDSLVYGSITKDLGFIRLGSI